MSTSAHTEKFRDSLSTVGEGGERVWVYPKKPGGNLHNYRSITAFLLLGLLLSGPFIRINGNPVLLFNVFDREFVILGQVFWPQDTYLLIFVLLIFVVFVIVFTVAYGRVWCGWACPQTVFMEMVFRKLEYWIEGDASSQRKLNAAKWDTKKIIKKGAKHLAFILISFIISHTVMAYLIGTEKTLMLVSQLPYKNLSGFTGLLAFTGIFYFVFAFFREQACTVVCPYGRLQGVLLDKNSIVVAYDWLRGEPRGKKHRNENQLSSKGDCINCTLCVQVCPTGIDIRNGTQLECVNCTACIDACDQVMTKIDRPTGLIRFDSYDGIATGRTLKFNPRLAAYTVILSIMVLALGYLVFNRDMIEATVTRVPGTLYTLNEHGDVSNLYQVQVINKSNFAVPFELRLKGGTGFIKMIGSQVATLNIKEKKEETFFIEMPASELHSGKNTIIIEIVSEGKVLDEIRTSFLAPVSKLNNQ